MLCRLQQVTDSNNDEYLWNYNNYDVGTWTLRDSMVLLKFDLATGNLDWALPIAGQLNGFAEGVYGQPTAWGSLAYGTDSVKMAVAYSSDTVFLTTQNLIGRVWFGSAATFSSTSPFLANPNPDTSGSWGTLCTYCTLTPVADLEWAKTTHLNDRTVHYKMSSAIVHISSSGSVDRSQVYDNTPDQTRYDTAFTVANYDNRVRTIGTWTAITADDQSDQLYIAGTFDGSVSTLSIGTSTGYGVDGTRNGNASSITTGVTTTYRDYSLLYDTQDAFIATFSSTLGYASSVYVLRGMDDAPIIYTYRPSTGANTSNTYKPVPLFGAGSGTLYSIVQFTNLTFYDNAAYTAGASVLNAMPTLGGNSWVPALESPVTGSSHHSYILLSLSSSLGSPAATVMYSYNEEIKPYAVGGNSGSGYIVATYGSELTFGESSTSTAPVTVYPRGTGATNFVTVAWGSQPSDEGTETTVTGYEDRRYQLRIGLGVGIGLGGGIIFILVLVLIIMLAMKGGSSSAGKIAPGSV